MKLLHQTGLLFTLCILTISCNGQTQQWKESANKIHSVDRAVENGEFSYYDITKTISPIDTSSGWNQPGQKILLTGIVYQRWKNACTRCSVVLLSNQHRRQIFTQT